MKHIELIAPENWTDVTLKQYRFLLDAQRRYNLEKTSDILEYRVEQMSILNPDIPVEDLRKLRMSQAKEYFDAINVLYDKEPVKEEVKSFTIDGKKYELLDFKHLSLAQWIDSEKYSDIFNANKLIAIFYIHPEEYDDIVLDKVADWLDDQPATKSFYLISQFFFIQKTLEKATELYLEKTKKEMERMEKVMRIAKRIEEKMKSSGLIFWRR